MTLKFDKDVDALEEIVIRPVKDESTIYMYSNSNFTASFYKVSKRGLKSLVKTLTCDSIHELQIDITRFDDGFLTLHPCQSSDNDDTFIITNDYNHIIIIPNGAVTLEYYEH